MWLSEEGANYAANKALRKLGIDTKTEKNFIAPEQTVDAYDIGTPGVKFVGLTLAVALDNTPDKLFFSVDGVVSECPKKETEGEAVYGNLSVVNAEFEDSGESFCFVAVSEDVWEGYIKTEENSVTISAWTQTETTTPISDKYLPEGFGGGGPVVIDFDALGIGDAFNELIDKGGGSTQITFPSDFWSKIHRDSLVIMSVEIAAYGFCMCTLMGNYNISDEDVVFRLFAKEIIDGSLITVTLDALSSSLSVAMIKLS